MALIDPRINHESFSYSCGDHMELNESYHNDIPNYAFRSNSYSDENRNSNVQNDFMDEILSYKIKQMEALFDKYCDSLNNIPTQK